MEIIVIALVIASLVLAAVEIIRGNRDLVTFAVVLLDIGLLIWFLGR